MNLKKSRKRPSPVISLIFSATPAMIVASLRELNSGSMPPFQVWRNGLEQEAVISGRLSSAQLSTGRTMSPNSQEPVHSISLMTIISTLGSTLAAMLYAHLALFSRLTLAVHWSLVGVGMCVLPVNILPLTISGRSS